MTPPFDIAVDYARAQRNNCELVLRTEGLHERPQRRWFGPGQSSLKCKGGLLFVLDGDSARTTKRCWSDGFRAGLLTLTTEEQATWRQLVLNMTVNDVYELPKVWRREATRFVAKVSPEVVVHSPFTWWPDPKVSTVWPIQTGGSHLLKYFVWLLSLAAETKELETQCIELVCRLSEVDWKPRERAQKVMITATFYLCSFSPEVSWPALQRLAQWSSLAPGGTKGDKIREILQAYCQKRELEVPALVGGLEKPGRTNG